MRKTTAFRFTLLLVLSLCAKQKASGQYTLSDTSLAGQLLRDANQLYTIGKIDSACQKTQLSLKIYQAVVDSNHVYLAQAYSLYATLISKKGKYADATFYFEKALFISEKHPADKDLVNLLTNSGVNYHKLKRMDEAYNYYQRALDLCRELSLEKDLIAANTYNNIGAWYRQNKKYTEAMVFLKKSLAIRTEKLDAGDPVLADSYINMANYFSSMNEPDSTLHYYEKVLPVVELMEKNKNELYPVKANLLYYNLGYFHAKKYHFHRSTYYYQKALYINELYNIVPTTETAFDLMELALVYSRTGEKKKALETWSKGMDILTKQPGTTDPNLAKAYFKLSTVLSDNDEFARSNVYLNKAIAIYNTAPGKNKKNLSDAYNNIAWGLQQTGDLISAIDSMKKSLALKLALYEKGDINIIRSMYALANFSILAGNTDQASFYLKEASEQNQGKKYLRSANIYTLQAYILKRKGELFESEILYDKAIELGKKYINNLYIPDELMFAIRLKNDLNTALFAKTGNRAYLYNSKSLFDLSYPLDQPDIRKLSEHTSSGNYKQNLRPFVEAAITNAQLLYSVTDSFTYFQSAFNYCENSNALSLYQSINEENAISLGGIPDSVSIYRKDVAADIFYLEERLSEFEDTDIADSNHIAINLRVSGLRKEYETINQNLEVNYPDYNRLKNSRQFIDVKSIQRDLPDSGKAIVSYFVGDSSIFIFCIIKDDYRVVRVKKDFPLAAWVMQLRTGMTDFFVNPSMADQYSRLSANYTTAAWQLYEKLIAPIASILPEKVVIIPDGILSYIPFEALLAEKPADPVRWNQHHYWQNDHTISYCYSATMLREMKNRKHLQEPSISFIGFAPQYAGDTTLLASHFQVEDRMRKDLKPLPYSGEEVYRAAKIMGGQSYIGASATEAAFLASAGKARIVHLSTHGQANDKNGDLCFLVFSEQKDRLENEILYAREIYNLRINADLVTLSACETGIGELQNGEGMISLARAFSFAGAKSIVTSLWSVSDGKTKDLMVDFYKNIHGGMSGDAALREAKRAFLKNHKGLAAHPFYWAGFIGIGDMGP